MIGIIKSKDLSSFEKYLQHLVKKDVTIEEMVVVINNLGISLKDTKIFGGIIRTKEMGYFDISFVNCSDILRNEFVKK